MTRAIFKLNNGDFINVPADQIDVRDHWICAWDGESLVAIVKAEIVDSCHLSKQKEGNCEK
jgi:hypothetical protein